MLDAIVGDAWRTELARTVVLPYVNKYMEKNNGKLPSMASIRNKCNSLPLDDYVLRASIEWLQQLDRDRLGVDIRKFFTGETIRRQIE